MDPSSEKNIQRGGSFVLLKGMLLGWKIDKNFTNSIRHDISRQSFQRFDLINCRFDYIHIVTKWIGHILEKAFFSLGINEKTGKSGRMKIRSKLWWVQSNVEISFIFVCIFRQMNLISVFVCTTCFVETQVYQNIVSLKQIKVSEERLPFSRQMFQRKIVS